jgi:hypothetical protein
MSIIRTRITAAIVAIAPLAIVVATAAPRIRP